MSISGFDLAQARYDGATPDVREATDEVETTCLRFYPADVGTDAWECLSRRECPACGGVVCTEQTARLRWTDQALCAQTDPEAFFPEKGGSTREAKKVCAQCFVQAECLDWALSTNERFGIWGGLSERERRALQKHTDTERTAS